MASDNKIFDKIESLRTELFRLRKEREEVVFQKGLAAQDNKDLRENFAFNHLEEKERVLTGRILSISKEIETLVREKEFQGSKTKLFSH